MDSLFWKWEGEPSWGASITQMALNTINLFIYASAIFLAARAWL